MALRSLVLLSALAMWASCAQVNAPTGGPVDEQPPVLLGSEPPNGMLHARPDLLVMTFDEFVQLKNTSAELFLSPPLPGVRTLETRVRGKRVEVSFPPDAQWQQNTTYVLNFGAAVVDLHESNAADGLMWAFSTGSRLDTLTIEGFVRRSLDGKPVERCRVLAYPETVPMDSMLSGGIMPQQVAVSGADGSFVLRHLAAGDYRLLSVSDDNRDYHWDAGEAAGLMPDLATAGDSTMVSILHSATAQRRQDPRILSSEVDSTGFIRMAMDWGTAEEVDQAFYRWQPALGQVGQSSGSLAHWAFADSIWVWSEAPIALDTVVWHWSAPELGWNGWDTIRVRRARPEPSHEPRLSNARELAGKSFAQATRRFAWSRPLSDVDLSLWTFSRDSVVVSPEGMSWVSPREFELTLNEGADERWQLICAPGGVADHKGMGNRDSLVLDWSTHPQDHAGRLMVRVDGLSTPGWLGNTATRDSVYVQRDTMLVWSEMMPGKTGLTFSSDRNGDRLWAQTNPEEWTPAEPRRVLQEGIDIRSNWDVEIVVDFSEMP